MESAECPCEKITPLRGYSASALPTPTLDRNVCALNAVPLSVLATTIFRINTFPSSLGLRNSICLGCPSAEGTRLQRGSYLPEQVRDPERLRHAPIAPISRVGTGHEDNRQRRVEFQNTVGQLQAVHFWHHDI